MKLKKVERDTAGDLEQKSEKDLAADGIINPGY
jgi:hypothetical protein